MSKEQKSFEIKCKCGATLGKKRKSYTEFEDELTCQECERDCQEEFEYQLIKWAEKQEGAKPNPKCKTRHKFQEAEGRLICIRCGQEKKQGKGGGKPSKKKNFIEALEYVLSDFGSVMAFTDGELLDEVNDLLKKEDKIKRNTLTVWKMKMNENNYDELDETGRKFVRLYKRALRDMKKRLMKRLALGGYGWQAKAWIIERKFAEWNLKQISEKTLTLNVNLLDGLHSQAEKTEEIEAPEQEVIEGEVIKEEKPKPKPVPKPKKKKQPALLAGMDA